MGEDGAGHGELGSAIHEVSVPAALWMLEIPNTAEIWESGAAHPTCTAPAKLQKSQGCSGKRNG